MHRITSNVLIVFGAALAVASCSEQAPTANSVLRAAGPASLSSNPDGNNGHITYAVIGDFPYGPTKRTEMPLLVDKINADPSIERLIHVGDIKAGSASDCSDAYFADIREQFDRVDVPLVYTPGDNEWTDCHKDFKNNGFYTPTERLDAVRRLFYPVVGRTLGIHSKNVTSQAEVDPANATYVENVMWNHANVVFATVHITGSNDDTAPWGALPPNASSFPSQTDERAARTAANRAWIDRAFDTGKEAKAVVLIFQADLWDGTLATRPTTISAFDDVVVQIGQRAAAFGRPVLLIMGDSHVFRLDTPYTPSSPLFVLHPNTPVAPNVTRLVVNGSAARTEYVRLTINTETKSGSPFTFVEVPLF